MADFRSRTRTFLQPWSDATFRTGRAVYFFVPPLGRAGNDYTSRNTVNKWTTRTLGRVSRDPNTNADTCRAFVTARSGSSYRSAERRRVLAEIERCFFSAQTRRKPARWLRPCAQDNAPPVGVKIQPHRVISRHHLVQFFRDPNELFLSSHHGIYPRGGVASGQENQRRRRKLAKMKCFGSAKSDFTHNVLHSAQRRVLLRDAI